MSSATLTGRLAAQGGSPNAETASAAAPDIRTDPAFQAFWLLRIGFTVLPIVFGLDKFFDAFVNWEIYLAPWMNDVIPGNAAEAMYAVGVIEVLAGVAVAIKPRYAAYVVAAWLGGIIVSLLSIPGYYDIALRDFGLLLGALTLARLASRYDPPLFRGKA
jgi:uncharacterized membrane protein YphA (DoxX/SURF4 family)